jgi:putative FmdB family regulatory protein
MPTYDYRCDDCGLEVEVRHGIHDRGPSTCGSCGGVTRKAMSTPAIHFKGSGWAKKDARAAAKTGPSPSSVASTDAKPSEPGAATTSGSEGKAESAATVSPPASGDRAATTKSTSSGSE